METVGGDPSASPATRELSRVQDVAELGASVDLESAIARTGQQWPPDREACIRRRTERSERLRERESAGSAGVADAGGTMRSFTCNAPVRLHDGAAAFGGGERILVLLKELLYLSRDPAPGGSRELENSRGGGERRPLAAQANSATGHSITLPSRSHACQAYRVGYSPQLKFRAPESLTLAKTSRPFI